MEKKKKKKRKRKWISEEAIVTAGESGLVNCLWRFLKKQGDAQLEVLQ